MAQNEYIPLELYRPIVETISDRNTLLSLLLASRHLSTEAERILYRNIEWGDAVLSQTLFFRTVINCPRVAQLVWRYHFFSNSLIADDNPYWTLFSAALRALVNLKELGFRRIGPAPAAHVLRGCTFQLVSLYWECHNDENELSLFLAGQEALERLYVVWGRKCAGPPACALQNLSFLAGTSGTIQAFLPGRTITRLRWYPYFGDQVPDVASISSALRNLHVLALDGPVAHSSLSTIVDCLPNLRFLELVGHRETDLLYIHRLPHLEGLVISMSIPSEECQDLVMRLYSETKSLLFIDIFVVNSGNIPNGYQRWYRDSTEPVRITPTRLIGAWVDSLGDFMSNFDHGSLLVG
jgi:hypothetical protein